MIPQYLLYGNLIVPVCSRGDLFSTPALFDNICSDISGIDYAEHAARLCYSSLSVRKRFTIIDLMI